MGLMGRQDSKLHEAVRFADLDDVKQALKEDCDPNEIGLYQWSPLHEAAHLGDVDILCVLLEHGGNVNIRDELKGRSPLHYAVTEGHVDCVHLLIESGAVCNLPDVDGNTPLQLDTGQCRHILQQASSCNYENISDEVCIESVSSLVSDEVCIDQSVSNLVSDGVCIDQSVSSVVSDEVCIDQSVSSLVSDEDDSVCSNWSSMGSGSLNEQSPDLGHVELSFEYDSRKRTLRIRVWQLTDVLLPAERHSVINTIFIKSLLIPDSSRETKRKTEEIKVTKAMYNTNSGETTGMPSGCNPLCLKFSKTLDYKGISKEDIGHKTIQIELCVTQKYHLKTYLIAMCRLPCKTAVKKLLRQKYALISCNNRSIPKGLKLCGFDHLQVPSTRLCYHSYPNLQTGSNISLNSGSLGYPASDSAITEVLSHKADSKYTSDIVIDIVRADGNAGLSEVKSVNVEDFISHSSLSTSVSIGDLVDDEELNSVTCHKAGQSGKDVQVDIPLKSSKIGLSKSGNYTVQSKHVNGRRAESKSPNLVQLLEVRKFPHDLSAASCRPSTPTWDHSDVYGGGYNVLRETSIDVDVCKDPVNSYLPLPTKLEVPCKQTSFTSMKVLEEVLNPTDPSKPYSVKGKRPVGKKTSIHWKPSKKLFEENTESDLPLDSTSNTESDLPLHSTSIGFTDEYKLPNIVQNFRIPDQVYIEENSD